MNLMQINGCLIYMVYLYFLIIFFLQLKCPTVKLTVYIFCRIAVHFGIILFAPRSFVAPCPHLKETDNIISKSLNQSLIPLLHSPVYNACLQLLQRGQIPVLCIHLLTPPRRLQLHQLYRMHLDLVQAGTGPIDKRLIAERTTVRPHSRMADQVLLQRRLLLKVLWTHGTLVPALFYVNKLVLVVRVAGAEREPTDWTDPLLLAVRLLVDPQSSDVLKGLVALVAGVRRLVRVHVQVRHESGEGQETLLAHFAGVG